MVINVIKRLKEISYLIIMIDVKKICDKMKYLLLI